MKNKTACLFICFLFPLFFLAAKELQRWEPGAADEQTGEKLIFYAAPGAEIDRFPSGEKTPEGERVLAVKFRKIPHGFSAHNAQLCFYSKLPLKSGKRYRLSFSYRGSQPGKITAGPGQMSSPWKPLQSGIYKELSVQSAYQRYDQIFSPEKECLAVEGYALPRMMIGNYPEGGVLYIGTVTLAEMPDILPLSLLSPDWRLKYPDGKTATAVFRNGACILPEPVREKEEFLFTNEFESPKAGIMQIGMSADWWMKVSANGKAVYDTLRSGNASRAFRPNDHVFNIPVKEGKNTLAVWVQAGSVGCRLVFGEVPYRELTAQVSKLFTVKEGAAFRPVAVDRFLIQPGTALDFSELNGTRVPAGTYGRVIVNAQGKLAFEKKPDEPIRFNGMNFVPGYWRLKAHSWTPKDIERFADAIAARGWNLIRFHFLPRYLLGTRVFDRPNLTIAEAGMPQTAEEIQFDPESLDRFDYMIACFKERGIYVNIDLAVRALTSMAWAYNDGPGEKSKTDLLFDPRFRKNWEASTRFLMNRVNPYTRLALKDEPTIAFVNFFNEQDFIIGNQAEMERFKLPFQNYLKKKYRTAAALSQSWGVQTDFEKAGVIREDVLRRGGVPAKDTGDFLTSVMREMTDWFLARLRESGYPGLYHHWDMIMRTMDIPIRATMPVIAQHTYFAHPNPLPTRNLTPKSKGAVFMGGRDTDMTVDQSSSLNSSYFRAAAMARFLDRPYMITEYSHSAFNRFRHERGLYFGAFAALQDWDDLTPHSDPLRLTVDPMWCFEHGMDPICHASETVVSLLFQRRDVKTAQHSVAIMLKSTNLFPDHYLSAVSDDYAKLAMLTKVGILYPEEKTRSPVGVCKPDMAIEAHDFSRLNVSEWYVNADNTDNGKFSGLLAELRRKKILPPENRTDWNKRIFQSETGELTLDMQKQKMTVAAPRLEGAILKQGQTAELPVLKVGRLSVPASVAAASLKMDETLKDASRILLIVSTNAFNTDMTFEDETLFCCVNPGELPVLVESVKGNITLKTTRQHAPKVYALHLDGIRFAEIPVLFQDGTLSIPLDTSTLEYGTPFFEVIY